MKNFEGLKVPENWLPVIGYCGMYSVSNYGRVRPESRDVKSGSGTRVSVERMLKPWNVGIGYSRVSLFRDNVADKQLVHRLVLEAFVGPCPDGMESAHSDGNPRNNSIWNLRWATHPENIHDRIGHGTVNSGTKNGRSKLTNDDVIEIRRLLLAGDLLQKKIASMFGVSSSAIQSIKRNKNWSWLGGGAG